MSRKFRAKKKKKVKKRVFVFLLLFVVAFVCTFKALQKVKIHQSEEVMISYMMNDANHHIKKSSKDVVVETVGNFLFHFDPKEPLSILSNSLLYQPTKQEEEPAVETVVMQQEKVEDYTDHVVDPDPVDITKPVVYLYNTHQTEEYSMENQEVHNITPNVMFASYVLKEQLNNLGIATIVEENGVPEYLNSRELPYYKSYDATREFMKAAINTYPTLNYFIDIHRDGLKKELSTTQMDGVNYAKVMFVVGLDNPNYQANLDLANKLNDKIKEKYPDLTRGVSTKKGEDVNGVYNQDIHKNTLLIECGGNGNTIEEVSNTMGLIAPLLKEVIES